MSIIRYIPILLIGMLFAACPKNIDKIPVDERETVTVKTIEQFYAALKSDTKILIEAGDYFIPQNDSILLEHPHYNNGNLYNLNNIDIIGKGKVSFLQADNYAPVLKFKNCQNIQINNISFGHAPEVGWCRGGVLFLKNCNDVFLEKLELFGSGTEGLTLITIENLTVKNSIIHHCTEQLSSISNCRNILYENMQIKDNEANLLRGFAIYKSEVHFKHSIINQPQFTFSLKQSDYGNSYGDYFQIDDYNFGEWHLEGKEKEVKAADPPIEKSKITFFNTTINGTVINGRIE